MKKEAELFKILGEPTRLRLVALLSRHDDICVCQLAEALNESDYNISRHLGVLRAAGVVEDRREGTWIYYKLSQPRTRLEACLSTCFQDCLDDHKIVKRDLKRLAKASCRMTKS